MPGVDAGTVYASIRLDLNRLNADVRNAQGNFRRISQSGTAAANQLNNKWSSAFNSVGIASAIAFAGVARLGKEIITVASDAEETGSKFRTVFGGIEEAATDAASTLVESFGQSQKGAEQLLGDVGDILTGFGFARDEALELAEATSQLGVDLASFTNFAGGAQGATQALTKALLGEAESVKALGIVIRQDTAEYKDLVEEIQRTEGATLLQAKALAALRIATKQSQNAIGDFQRTQDSLANRSRVLRNRIEDLKVELGEELIPIANDLIGVAKTLVEGFASLDDGAQKTILTVVGTTTAAIALAPAINAAALAARTLRTALAGPVGMVVALGGATIALIKWAQAARDARGEAELAELSQEAQDLAETTGISAANFTDAIGLMQNAFREIARTGGSAIEQARSTARLLEITMEEAIPLILENIELTGDQRAALLDYVAAQELSIEASRDEAQALRELNAEIEANADLTESVLTENQQLVADAADALRQAFFEIDQRANVFGEAVDVAGERLGALQGVLDALFAEGFTVEGSGIQFIIDLYEQLGGQIGEAADAEALLAANTAATEEAFRQRQATYENLAVELQVREQERLDEQEKAEEDQHQRRLERAQELIAVWGGQFSAFFAAIDDISSASADAELQRLKVQINAEEKGTDKRLALEEEYDKKSRELQLEAAKRRKALGIFNATVSTASAIIGFLADPGGVAGVVLSALAGVTGAAQIAAIAAQPLPALAAGGYALPAGQARRGADVRVAENGSAELMFNAGTKGEPFLTAFAEKMAEVMQTRSGGDQVVQPIIVGGREVARQVIDFANRRVFPLNESAIARGR